MNFTEYLLTVAGAASVGILADIVNDALFRRNKGMEKYISFGITVCIAAGMIIPLIGSFKSGIPAFTDWNEQPTSAVQDTSDSLYILERECEEGLMDRIISEAGIVPESIEIEMTISENVPKITSALTVLDSKNIDKIGLVKEISLSAIGRETEVVIKETNEGTAE